MAQLILNNSNSPTTMRLRINYTSGNGSINISSIEACRTDSYSTQANNTGVITKISIGGTITNCSSGSAYFNANSSYTTIANTSASKSGLSGSTTIIITFSNANANINNASFTGTIDAGYSYPVMSINSYSKGVSNVQLSLVYTQSTPTNIQVVNDINGNNLYTGTSLTPNITGIAPNTTLKLKVRGYANGGWGDYSSITTITTYDYAKILTKQDFNDEGNPTITYSNPGGSSNSSIMACISLDGGNTSNIPYRAINSTGTLSYTFNLTTAERNTIRNYMSNKKTITAMMIIRSTINSTNYYSIEPVNLSIINANPFSGGFSYVDSNSITTAITGNNKILILNVSNVQFTIPLATAQKGATITNYQVKCGSQYNNLAENGSTKTSTINKASSGGLSLIITDSRGNTTTSSITAPTITYNSPIISYVNTQRQNYINEATTLSVNGSLSVWSGLSKNNTIQSISYRYKQTGDSYWSISQSIAISNITYSGDNNGNWQLNNITINGDTTNGFNINNSYDIELTINDLLDSKTFIITLNSAQPLIWKNLQNKFIGIGKKPKYKLDVGGDIYTDGHIYASDGNDVPSMQIIAITDGYIERYSNGFQVAHVSKNYAGVTLTTQSNGVYATTVGGESNWLGSYPFISQPTLITSLYTTGNHDIWKAGGWIDNPMLNQLPYTRLNSMVAISNGQSIYVNTVAYGMWK